MSSVHSISLNIFCSVGLVAMNSIVYFCLEIFSFKNKFEKMKLINITMFTESYYFQGLTYICSIFSRLIGLLSRALMLCWWICLCRSPTMFLCFYFDIYYMSQRIYPIIMSFMMSFNCLLCFDVHLLFQVGNFCMIFLV